MAINIQKYFCDCFLRMFMKGGSFIIKSQTKERKIKMKTKEYQFYEESQNWDFSTIDYKSESLTNWDMYKILREVSKPSHKILDLGTGSGEKVIKYFPKVSEILATDYSPSMISTANKNIEKSERKDITFMIMDNLEMHVPHNYYDIITARHTKIDPKQIYISLKEGGYLIIRGVDKYDCQELKTIYNCPQDNNIPISIEDYTNILNAGFRDIELVPIHIREYYRTKEDFLKLLLKAPILNGFNHETIDSQKLDAYILRNTYPQGIRLIRRYYGITARK